MIFSTSKPRHVCWVVIKTRIVLMELYLEVIWKTNCIKLNDLWYFIFSSSMTTGDLPGSIGSAEKKKTKWTFQSARWAVRDVSSFSVKVREIIVQCFLSHNWSIHILQRVVKYTKRRKKFRKIPAELNYKHPTNDKQLGEQNIGFWILPEQRWAGSSLGSKRR